MNFLLSYQLHSLIVSVQAPHFVSIHDAQTTIQFSELSKIRTAQSFGVKWIFFWKRAYPKQDSNWGTLNLQPDALPLHHRTYMTMLSKLRAMSFLVLKNVKKYAAPSKNWTGDRWLCSWTLYHCTTELSMTCERKLRDMNFLVRCHSLIWFFNFISRWTVMIPGNKILLHFIVQIQMIRVYIS